MSQPEEDRGADESSQRAETVGREMWIMPQTAAIRWKLVRLQAGVRAASARARPTSRRTPHLDAVIPDGKQPDNSSDETR